MSGSSQPTSLMDSIRALQAKISTYGNGPHTPSQKEEIIQLIQLIQKAQSQLTTSSQPTPVSSMNSGMSGNPSSSMPSSVPSAARGQGPDKTVLDKKRLQDLVREVDPLEQLDDDVEELLMQVADDFIDNITTAACQMAKHRNASTVETKDVQLHLERNWNMWIPGFGANEVPPYKKAATTEAHKQRLALIKKTVKKY